MEDRYDVMMRDFEKYKMNREHVPLQELKTRYRKPYATLKERLKEDLEWYVKQLAFIGIMDIRHEDKENLVKPWSEQIQKIFDEESAAGLFRTLGAAVYKHLDLKEFEAIACYRLTDRIRYEVYAPYWLQHCRKEGDTYTNDLIGMTWNPKFKIWEGKTSEGYTAFCSKLPPTKELIEEARLQEAEDYKKYMAERKTG